MMFISPQSINNMYKRSYSVMHIKGEPALQALRPMPLYLIKISQSLELTHFHNYKNYVKDASHHICMCKINLKGQANKVQAISIKIS